MAKQSGGAGSKKHGRNKDKCTRYQNNHIREKNKVKRVLKASGIERAREWAALNGVAGYLQTLVRT